MKRRYIPSALINKEAKAGAEDEQTYDSIEHVIRHANQKDKRTGQTGSVYENYSLKHESLVKKISHKNRHQRVVLPANSKYHTMDSESVGHLSESDDGRSV